MTNGDALNRCEEFGREVLGMANPEGHMLTILTEMKGRASVGILDTEYYEAFTVAMEGFRQLFAPKVEG